MKSKDKTILLWMPLPENSNWRGEGIAQTVESLLRESIGSKYKFKIVTAQSVAILIISSLGNDWQRNISFTHNASANFESYELDIDFKTSTLEMSLIALNKFINKLNIFKIFGFIQILFYYLRLRIATFFMSNNITHRECEMVWAPLPSIPFLENINRNMMINFWDGFVLEYREFLDISPYILLKFKKTFDKKSVTLVTQSECNAQFLNHIFGVSLDRVNVFRLGCPDYSIHINSLNIHDKLQKFKNDRSNSILSFYPSSKDILLQDNQRNKRDVILKTFIKNQTTLSTLYRLDKSSLNGTKLIFISTQFRPYKGLNLALKIISECKKKLPGVTILLITTCYIPLGIKEKYPELFNSIFEFTRLKDKEHAVLTAISDLVLHPSFVEGGLGSYSMFEAASVGVPSLTNSGRHTIELNNQVKPDLNIAFQDFSNINATVDKISEILLDKSMGSAIIEAINKSRQEWSKTWEELEFIFEQKVK
jgi:glycosyltransferase involved in cell wall biosynthesis